MPDAIDVTTLTNVKTRLGPNFSGTGDDTLLSYLITSLSLFLLHEVGMGPMDWSIPAASPLVAQVPFNEWYDGNGSERMFLRNQPIVSVQALTINGVPIQASAAYGQPGYVIDGSGKSLAIRCGGAGSATTFTFSRFGFRGGGQYFQKGIQNINVQYTAGFASTPYDLQDKAEGQIAVTYQQKNRRDQASQAMAQGAGTSAFRDWAITPELALVIRKYKRVAMV